jgi:hypothetical protein
MKLNKSLLRYYSSFSNSSNNLINVNKNLKVKCIIFDIFVLCGNENEYNERRKIEIEKEYSDLEFCDISIYLKNIFELIKNNAQIINIDLDYAYNDILNNINKRKKDKFLYNLDFNILLNKICGSPILFELIVSKINIYNDLDYNVILLLNFGLINIRCNDDINNKVISYTRLMNLVIRLFDFNIEINSYNLIFLKYMDDLLMDFNSNNINYDKSLIKSKTYFLLNILSKYKSIIIFYPNILQICNSYTFAQLKR